MNNKKQANVQYSQDMKVMKNARIIALIFWTTTSLYIYSKDPNFADVYSLKPFIFFIIGPILSAIIFGNIIFFMQKIIEKIIISIFLNKNPKLIPAFVSAMFFIFLIILFLIIFELAKLVQLVLN